MPMKCGKVTKIFLLTSIVTLILVLHTILDVGFIPSNLLSLPKLVKLPRKDLPWWDDDSLYQCSQVFGPAVQKLETITYEDLRQMRKTLQPTVISTNWFETPYNISSNGTNHCGYRSSLRNSSQHVISFTIAGTNSSYWRGLPETIVDAAVLYPGYILRLHMNPRHRQWLLCPLLIKYPSLVDVCDVHHLPDPIGNISFSNPEIWRASPFGDPSVERFLVRDSDSKLSFREATAVQEWEESGRLMHIMRDNPAHTTIVLGGMYGIYQPSDTIVRFEMIRERLISNGGPNDQQDYYDVLPRRLLAASLQHDSYLCRTYRGALPFPTKRVGGDFVGSPVFRFNNSKVRKPCPKACRPKYHPDWTYC